MSQHDELTVPRTQAVRIEYPGYVQDVDAAVSTLGGRRLSDQHFRSAHSL